MDQLKDELVKDMSDQIEESIQSIDTKLEVDIIEPKIYTEEDLREREVCEKPSGFRGRWLQCSLILDKWYLFRT